MTVDMYMRSGLALLAVIVLLLGFAWVSRRFGLAGRIMPGTRRRLAVVEALALDNRRKLLLLRRDRVEHLVLLGPDNAIVVERGIPASTEFSQDPADQPARNLPRLEPPK